MMKRIHLEIWRTFERDVSWRVTIFDGYQRISLISSLLFSNLFSVLAVLRAGRHATFVELLKTKLAYGLRRRWATECLLSSVIALRNSRVPCTLVVPRYVFSRQRREPTVTEPVANVERELAVGSSTKRLDKCRKHRMIHLRIKRLEHLIVQLNVPREIFLSNIIFTTRLVF